MRNVRKASGGRMTGCWESEPRKLTSLSSSQAADWLLSAFPIESQRYWDGLLLIPHRSWRRSDQLRLARHYLQRIPFASARGYEIFASFMQVSTFLTCIRESLPLSDERLDLLLDYLIPVLSAMAKSPKDSDLVAAFVRELRG